MTPVWLFVFVVTASPNPQLATAEDLVAQVRYADAEKALALAQKVPNNPRETVLRILELQGIVAATLGQGAKASKYFQQLLSLDPERKLAEGLPPRVRTPYYEAKGMASEAPAMLFTASAETRPEGPVFHAFLSADPGSLARKARFHLREQAGGWKATDKPIASGSATWAPGPGRFEWWVELLGDQESSLFSAGTEEKPMVDGIAVSKAAPTPVAKAEPPPPPVPAPEPVVTPREDVPVAAARASGPGINPLVWVCIGAGAAAAVGGIVAGVLSRQAAGKVENAQKDADGFVVGMTQREAASIREQAKTQAIAANVLLGSAVVLAGTGVAIWVFSDRSSKVAVLPSPGGLVIAGEFP